MSEQRAKAACLLANEREQLGDVDIFRYFFHKDDVWFYLYKNETTDQVLEETFKYEISGLVYTSKYGMSLGSGEEKI